MYQIRRCRVCGKELHVHAMKKHHVIKNINCEHLPEALRDYARTQDIEQYTTTKSQNEIVPENRNKGQSNRQQEQRRI